MDCDASACIIRYRTTQTESS